MAKANFLPLQRSFSGTRGAGTVDPLPDNWDEAWMQVKEAGLKMEFFEANETLDRDMLAAEFPDDAYIASYRETAE